VTVGRRPPPTQAGYALIIVLWIIVLLALLTLHLEQAGRNEADLALNLRRAASLQAQVDGAISIAAFHLLDKGADAWHADGLPYVITIDDDAFTQRIVVHITSQAGKIDINTASAPVLQALATMLGSDPASARSVAANMISWRFPAGAGAALDAVTAPYKAAGRTYGPPGAPYESIDEMGLVLGVTQTLLAGLAPHVTIFHKGSPTAGLGDPVVVSAMHSAGVAMGAPQGATADGLQVVDVRATAYGAGGTTASREAILRLGRQKKGFMYILSWTEPGNGPVSN
jgi:general secretion pathway protein K